MIKDVKKEILCKCEAYLEIIDILEQKTSLCKESYDGCQYQIQDHWQNINKRLFQERYAEILTQRNELFPGYLDMICKNESSD